MAKIHDYDGTVNRLSVARKALTEASQATGLVYNDARSVSVEQTTISTGCAPIDKLLRGGFSVGKITDLTGPSSSGRLSIALCAIKHTVSTGALCALIDVVSAFDPKQLTEQERSSVLWVKSGSMLRALRSTEIVLDATGFALVVVYATNEYFHQNSQEKIDSSVWARIAQRAKQSRTVVLTVRDEQSVYSRPGVFASTSLRLHQGQAVFRFPSPSVGNRLMYVKSKLSVEHSRLFPAGNHTYLMFDPYSYLK